MDIGPPYGVSGDLLRSFKTHIAHSIWPAPGSGILPAPAPRSLRAASRPSQMSSVTRLVPRVAGVPWFHIVVDAGFGRLHDICFGKVDHILLTAFVERWHLETNSFHFPWGEITPTLHDIMCLMSLPIDGLRCCALPEDPETDELIDYIFGWDAAVMASEKPITAGSMMFSEALAYLRDMIHDDGDPGCIATLYMWLAVSSSLFVDKTTNKLRVDMLPLLQDSDRAARTAWGAGVLAFLYRHLGIASRAKTVVIAGCTYLLMVWIWTYFPFFPGNPNPRTGMLDDQRRAARYRVQRTALRRTSDILDYRRILDQYRPEDVSNNLLNYRYNCALR